MAIKFVNGDITLTNSTVIVHLTSNSLRQTNIHSEVLCKTYFNACKRFISLCKNNDIIAGEYYIDKLQTPWLMRCIVKSNGESFKEEYLIKNLDFIVNNWKRLGFTSIAMTRIPEEFIYKTEWTKYKKLLIEKLDPLPIPVFIYEKHEQNVEAPEKN